MITKFTIYLDIAEQLQDSVINELCTISSDLTIPLSPYGNSKFNIEKVFEAKIKNETLLTTMHSRNVSGITNPNDFLKNDLLKFECEIKIPNKIPQELIESWNEENKAFYSSMDPVDFNLSYSYDIVKKRINDLIFAVNLAKIGSISIKKYIIFQDENKNIMAGKEISYKNFKQALKSNSIWGYPRIKELKIVDVWNWLITFPDYLLGFSSCPTTRALINLNEMPKSDSNMKLFRAVMGLEAIYAEGNTNLQKQVKEKSQAVLGIQTEFKILYKSMYDFRSKYIHGELDFASGSHLDTSSQPQKYYEGLEKSTDFALLILYASIQELIIRNWEGYKFSYNWIANDIKN